MFRGSAETETLFSKQEANMNAKTIYAACFLPFLAAGPLGATEASPVRDGAVVVTQNSVLNMFISAIPLVTSARVVQAGEVNGVAIIQLDPSPTPFEGDWLNEAFVSQFGADSHTSIFQYGQKNIAVLIQDGRTKEPVYLTRSEYDFSRVDAGFMMRFRSGEVDIVALTPPPLTTVSTFGRSH